MRLVVGLTATPTGKLPTFTNVRPNRLITIDRNIVLYRAGHLSDQRVNDVVAKAVQILSK